MPALSFLIAFSHTSPSLAKRERSIVSNAMPATLSSVLWQFTQY